MSHTTNPTWLKYRKALFRRQGSPMNAQPAYFPASDCRCRLISSALWNALAPTSQLLTSVDDEVAFLHGEHMRQTPVAAAVRSVRPKAMRLVAVGDQPFAKIAKPLEVSQAFWRRHTTSAVIARRCRDPVITHTPAPARPMRARGTPCCPSRRPGPRRGRLLQLLQPARRARETRRTAKIAQRPGLIMPWMLAAARWMVQHIDGG